SEIWKLFLNKKHFKKIRLSIKKPAHTELVFLFQIVDRYFDRYHDKLLFILTVFGSHIPFGRRKHSYSFCVHRIAVVYFFSRKFKGFSVFAHGKFYIKNKKTFIFCFFG